ncbi:WD40/YVTN/BNR-like repeat-containing protein [Rufibacter roseus]|uniref:WD40/YVTN/BNR-like repeat-containing protein n=1 Tax=Rufibacter roseus TaxID=1567108 RepID=A0ABW2DHA8_9BACT|nr:glycosyl hydrolase [Rufibacter roseus]
MLRKPLYPLVLAGLLSLPAVAQKKNDKQPPATPAKERLDGYQQRVQLQKNSLVSNLAFRNVGPTVMSGRVVDVDVNPADPTQFYVAYASGGLWRTVNNGISFEPLFDREAVLTIGDISVDWKNNTIWVGTGESNSSRSSYSGVGIYKSTDGGKTWQYKGLPESHHIGRVIQHPTDPNTVWVAALGHLYSPNPERGVYKTTDGGNTWKLVLKGGNENTGAVDLVVDPANPNNLYASLWHRERRAWNFVEGGSSSGVFKSTNGGESWQRVSGGFPTGEGIGRIGLSIFPSNPNIIYASVDNQDLRKDVKPVAQTNKLRKEQFKDFSKEDFLKLDDALVNAFLDENNFPRQYTAKSVKEMVRTDKLRPVALSDFLVDANSAMIETPVTGAQVYRSADGGKTWAKAHESYIDDMYYTYGYYFGVIRVSPLNADHVYLLGVPLLKSEDAGKTWKEIGGPNVHSDHQDLWVSPNRPGHLVNGNDGGINITYDDGKTWFKANTPAVGQFYSVAIDMATPYHVYGGLQDNGVWGGPSTYQASLGWTDNGRYPYQRYGGGDGMMVQVDFRDNNTLYSGSQYGNYFRLNKATGQRMSIKPRHELGERPLRFNWETPILLSRHNQDVLYYGSNKFHRSLNKGENLETLSGDLTKGGRLGDVGYGTLTSIEESPKRFGLLYVGSDDGLIHVSRDGGYTWAKISDKLPQNMWVSSLAASSEDEGTVYATLNGYRWDDFTPYLYVSQDYGKTWKRIGTNLPKEPLNVVKEDPKNPNLLYVGSDNGLYVSLDKGQTFQAMGGEDLPSVAVHDLAIHPRENDLIVGTHGRSIYIGNLAHLQQLTPAVQAKGVHAFPVNAPQFSERWGQRYGTWSDAYVPSISVPFYVNSPGVTTIRIKTDKGLVLKELTDQSERGLNYVTYDLTHDSSAASIYEQALNEGRKAGEQVKVATAADQRFYLRPGKYVVEIEANGSKATQEFTLKAPERRQGRE